MPPLAVGSDLVGLMPGIRHRSKEELSTADRTCEICGRAPSCSWRFGVRQAYAALSNFQHRASRLPCSPPTYRHRTPGIYLAAQPRC